MTYWHMLDPISRPFSHNKDKMVMKLSYLYNTNCDTLAFEWILINISLEFVPMGPINNIPVLVQIMAWHRLGHKPLSEPIMVRLLSHICITRPQWVNTYGWNTLIPWINLYCHMFWLPYIGVICIVYHPIFQNYFDYHRWACFTKRSQRSNKFCSNLGVSGP